MSELVKYQTITAGFLTGGPECYCGRKDWFPKGEDEWKCSYCCTTRTAQHKGIIIDGPKCYCGRKDWFVGNEGVCCSYCASWRGIKDAVLGYIIDGPKCYCGRKDWIVGNSSYRCTYCDKER